MYQRELLALPLKCKVACIQFPNKEPTAYRFVIFKEWLLFEMLLCLFVCFAPHLLFGCPRFLKPDINRVKDCGFVLFCFLFFIYLFIHSFLDLAASFLAYWIVASVLFEVLNGKNDTTVLKLYSL